jgi:hypothetical protein
MLERTMPLFRTYIPFTGMKPRHVESLRELMRELPCGGGTIARASESPAADFPTGVTYHCSNDDYETASDFRGWLQGLIESRIHHPVELFIERMDDDTGLALPD